MKKLLLLAFIIIAVLFLWNRSNLAGTQWGQLLSSGGQATESSGGGPVREWEHAAADITANEAALPQPQNAPAPRAMVDSVRQGLQNSGRR
jgi:hypothetical protein